MDSERRSEVSARMSAVRRLAMMLCVVLAVSLATDARAAVAQSVTTDQLAAAALSTFDLGDYEYSQDGDVKPPQGFDAAFARTFATTDHGGSLLIDSLFAAGPTLAPAKLAPVVQSGMMFNGFRDGGKRQTTNYALTGPLGIGDTDQSAVWSSYDDAMKTWSTWYADAFLQGRALSVVIYIAPPATADGAALRPLALLQDQKLLGDGVLPPDVVGSPTAATVR